MELDQYVECPICSSRTTGVLVPRAEWEAHQRMHQEAGDTE